MNHQQEFIGELIRVLSGRGCASYPTYYFFKKWLSLIICLMPLPAIAETNVASFQGLGFLPGGKDSFARAISAKGSVVIGGASTPSGLRAFRYSTQTKRMQALEHFREIWDISADASVVVGTSERQAFRFSATTKKMQGLGFLPNGKTSEAHAVSDDGAVIAGTATTGSVPQPFWWITGTKQIESLKLPTGAKAGEAIKVSADGSIIVGHVFSLDGSYLEAVLWSVKTKEVRGLGYLPDGNESWGRDVSADGSIVIGDVTSASGYFEAFRWSAKTKKMQGLGFLPGGNKSSAQGVSADGMVVVGGANSTSGSQTFIWNKETGMRNLKDLLVNQYKLDIKGWTLERAVDISADGMTIVGDGKNPAGQNEAWIANIASSGN